MASKELLKRWLELLKKDGCNSKKIVRNEIEQEIAKANDDHDFEKQFWGLYKQTTKIRLELEELIEEDIYYEDFAVRVKELHQRFLDVLGDFT